jgi:ankyrin repeat protein
MSCSNFFGNNQVQKIKSEEKNYQAALGLMKAGDVDALEKMILKKDISVTSLDEGGKTLLMHAVAMEAKTIEQEAIQLQMIKMLLKNKSNINAQDFFSNTALCYATLPSVVSLLLDAKPDVNLGLPIVPLAANRNYECVKMLMNKKAKISRQYLVEHYTLTDATTAESKDAPQHLLDLESVDIRDKRLKTALGFLEIIQKPDFKPSSLIQKRTEIYYHRAGDAKLDSVQESDEEEEYSEKSKSKKGKKA